jgi:hypothetical protein
MYKTLIIKSTLDLVNRLSKFKFNFLLILNILRILGLVNFENAKKRWANIKKIKLDLLSYKKGLG